MSTSDDKAMDFKSWGLNARKHSSLGWNVHGRWILVLKWWCIHKAHFCGSKDTEFLGPNVLPHSILVLSTRAHSALVLKCLWTFIPRNKMYSGIQHQGSLSETISLLVLSVHLGLSIPHQRLWALVIKVPGTLIPSYEFDRTLTPRT